MQVTTHQTSNTGTDSLSFCRPWVNNHTHQSMQFKRHTSHTGIPHPPFTHTNAHNKDLFCLIPWRLVYFGLWVCMHAHCNPHVFSPSCQGPICLHYHHTAGGSRSVRTRGNSNASLSWYKNNFTTWTFVISPHHRTGDVKREIVLRTAMKLRFWYFQKDGWKLEWWLCLQSC